MKNLDKETSNKIQGYIEDFEQRTYATVLYLTKSGSKLYGTDNENSDLDIKGLFIPSKQSILLKKDLGHYVRDTNNSKVKNTKDDIDMTLHSIHSFFNHLSKSETGAVDILFSIFSKDTIIYENKEFTDILRENYKYFLNRNMKSFIGYSLGQTKRFGIKGARYDELDTFVKYLSEFPIRRDIPLSEYFEIFGKEIENRKFNYIKFVTAKTSRTGNEEGTYISVLGKMFEGTINLEYFLDRINKLYLQFGNRTKKIASTESKTDFKALYNSARVALEVKELLETEFIQFPLNDAKYLKEIKEGNIPVEEVINKIQDILAEVDELLLISKLPDEVDESYIDLMILRILDEFAL